MKEEMNTEHRVCPKCRNCYDGIPALAREDGETLICPDCGIRESLESIGIKPPEQEQILKIIHRARRNEAKRK